MMTFALREGATPRSFLAVRMGNGLGNQLVTAAIADHFNASVLIFGIAHHHLVQQLLNLILAYFQGVSELKKSDAIISHYI